jgi:hypothetical protein
MKCQAFRNGFAGLTKVVIPAVHDLPETAIIISASDQVELFDQKKHQGDARNWFQISDIEVSPATILSIRQLVKVVAKATEMRSSIAADLKKIV